MVKAPSRRALPAGRRHLPGVRRGFVLGTTSLFACGVVGLTACGTGSGEGDESGDGGRGDERSTELAAGDAEPEATDAAAVLPYVEQLLVDYDTAVNQIVGDPAVAGDPEHPLVLQYLDLYEPGSDFARELVDTWEERGREGLSTRPFDDEHPASLTRLDGDIEVASGDEVTFPVCIERRLVVVDGEGRTTQRTPYREQRGEGIAVRVDGEWRLRELGVIENTAQCLTGDHGEGTTTGGPGGTGGAGETGGTEGAEGA